MGGRDVERAGERLRQEEERRDHSDPPRRRAPERRKQHDQSQQHDPGELQQRHVLQPALRQADQAGRRGDEHSDDDHRDRDDEVQVSEHGEGRDDATLPEAGEWAARRPHGDHDEHSRDDGGDRPRDRAARQRRPEVGVGRGKDVARHRQAHRDDRRAGQHDAEHQQRMQIGAVQEPQPRAARFRRTGDPVVRRERRERGRDAEQRHPEPRAGARSRIDRLVVEEGQPRQRGDAPMSAIPAFEARKRGICARTRSPTPGTRAMRARTNCPSATRAKAGNSAAATITASRSTASRRTAPQRATWSRNRTQTTEAPDEHRDRDEHREPEQSAGRRTARSRPRPRP